MNTAELTKIWRASARDAQLDKAEFRRFEVAKAAKAVVAARLSLRAEGHVVYGISQICNSKASLLLQDSERVDENTGASFREYTEKMLELDPASKRQRLNDVSSLLDLDTRGLPESLLPGGSAAATKAHTGHLGGDISVDDALRAADDAMADAAADTTADLAFAGAGENAGEDAPGDVSDALDFTDLLEGPASPPGGAAASPAFGLGSDPADPGLDFGPDPEYSSSPPHTPSGAALHDDIMADDDDVPALDTRRRPGKKSALRSAPVDDEIDEIESVPKSHLLRRLPAPPAPRKHASSDAFRIVADALVDPAFVIAHMRELRAKQAEAEGAFGEAAPSEIGAADSDGGLDFGLDDDQHLDDGDGGVGVDENDLFPATEEELKEDTKRARAAVRSALGRRGQRVAFSALASDRRMRACTLMEVLQLAAKGRVAIEQQHAWGDLVLSKN